MRIHAERHRSRRNGASWNGGFESRIRPVRVAGQRSDIGPALAEGALHQQGPALTGLAQIDVQLVEARPAFRSLIDDPATNPERGAGGDILTWGRCVDNALDER